MGIVAHPNEVTSLAVSFDGRFLFSAGGFDLSVNMWKIDVEEHKRGRERAAVLVAGDSEGGEEVPVAVRNSMEAAALRPYFSLLEGGEGGELHHDIVDYFYYCQLRTLGEDSMETRRLTGEIPLEEMPSLFRSVGFYPSEDEVLNMVNEVRYKDFVNTGETQDFVGLVSAPPEHFYPLSPLDTLTANPTFLLERVDQAVHQPPPRAASGQTLYQHRVLGHQRQVSLWNVLLNFRRPILRADERHDLQYSVVDHPNSSHQLSWDLLRTCLLEEGECITAEDLDAFLVALTGGDSSCIAGNQLCDPKSFAEHILGFEDFANSSTV